MGRKSITDVVAVIVGELSDLTSEERQRVVQASLMLLGETQAKPTAEPIIETSDSGGSEFSARARAWIKQTGLSLEEIQQVFHFGDDGAEIIASEIPGKNYRERTRNAYLLCGISKFLTSDDAKFDDKAARELCERSGSYDPTNHAKHLKGGNEFSGSKDKGWTLTAPGLKQGAALISSLSDAS